jgi:hypothetical protein
MQQGVAAAVGQSETLQQVPSKQALGMNRMCFLHCSALHHACLIQPYGMQAVKQATVGKIEGKLS